jgi:hypothetical protein
MNAAESEIMCQMAGIYGSVWPKQMKRFFLCWPSPGNHDMIPLLDKK